MTTRFPIRIIAAALFALSALLGAPSAQDASLAIGTPAAAAQEGWEGRRDGAGRPRPACHSSYRTAPPHSADFHSLHRMP